MYKIRIQSEREPLDVPDSKEVEALKIQWINFKRGQGANVVANISGWTGTLSEIKHFRKNEDHRADRDFSESYPPKGERLLSNEEVDEWMKVILGEIKTVEEMYKVRKNQNSKSGAYRFNS